MSQRTRATLKNFFKEGDLPTAGNFADLIDSVVNKIDDGIDNSQADGLKITPLGENRRLISFYGNFEDDLPEWSIELDKDNNLLSFVNGKGEYALNLDETGKVGIGTKEPKSRLHVVGTVASTGRLGVFTGSEKDDPKGNKIPADGSWHPILTNLDGCHAYEIMAGVGKFKTGKYALLHATALTTFGRSWKRIRRTQAHYRWPWHRIGLRWKGKTHNFRLEMKTWTDYGENVFVQYHIQKLWFDHKMSGGQRPDSAQIEGSKLPEST